MAGKRILLLEDEPDIAELLALALDGEGYVVDLAATVAEARTRLDTLVYTPVIPICVCPMATVWRLPSGPLISVLRPSS
jgi:DNA-binding response OmpR family regulator